MCVLSARRKRLKPEMLQVKIKKRDIIDLTRSSASEVCRFLKTLKFRGSKQVIAKEILSMCLARLENLIELGGGYLSLDRSLKTLSGGEAQRIRLVSQLSSSLIGVLYVLDEPSIGLHPRDHQKILDVLEAIKNRG